MVYAVLIILLIISTLKGFGYKCGLRGILYHLEKTGNMPTEEKIKELTDMATRQEVRELFHRN